MIGPDDIQGHWVRHWIKAPGFEDYTTRVHWVQVGALYADVRVPMKRPALVGADALSDLSPRALYVLARAEGFAGHATLDNGICTWVREINWHGHPDEVDAGRITFDDAGRMVEEGVHADYVELWEKRSGSGAQALQFSGAGYTGFLMARGEAFVLGIGTPDKPASADLVDALEEGKRPDGLADLFDGLHAVGTWSGDTAVSTLATNPFAEGKPAVRLTGNGLIWNKIAFDGTVSAIEMEFETAYA